VIRLRHASLVVLPLLTLWLLGESARAHDLERTQVSLTFETDGTFVLDVANDPNWLILRLEDFVGDYPAIPKAPAWSGPRSDADRDARLRLIAPAFIDRVVMWVSGREVRPTSVEYLAPAPPAPGNDVIPLGVYRMRGRFPLDATTLQWYYGIVVDPYPLVVHRADGRSATETVLGQAWSRQLDMTGQFRAPTSYAVARKYFWQGLRAILPGNIEQILFAVGIVLVGGAPRSLLFQVLAFVAGSSLGVGFRLAGIVVLAQPVTLQLVAASLAYVALENVVTRGVGSRRLATLALFGLLHGLTLGADLLGTAPPSGNLAATIVGFDAGAAAAQFTVAALAGLFLSAYSERAWYHPRIVVPASLALVTVAVSWMLVGRTG